MKKDFSGIVGAPVTPFHKKNRVDYGTFAKQINFRIKNGVSLIAHPMHIGESINLTIEGEGIWLNAWSNRQGAVSQPLSIALSEERIRRQTSRPIVKRWERRELSFWRPIIGVRKATQ